MSLLDQKYFTGSMPMFTIYHSFMTCCVLETFTSTIVLRNAVFLRLSHLPQFFFNVVERLALECRTLCPVNPLVAPYQSQKNGSNTKPCHWVLVHNPDNGCLCNSLNKGAETNPKILILAQHPANWVLIQSPEIVSDVNPIDCMLTCVVKVGGWC